MTIGRSREPHHIIVGLFCSPLSWQHLIKGQQSDRIAPKPRELSPESVNVHVIVVAAEMHASKRKSEQTFNLIDPAQPWAQ